jgi:type IV secretion system protein VirB10
MNFDKNKELNDSEQALSQCSQVTPKHSLKRKKEQLIFAALTIFALAYWGFSVWPDKTQMLAEHEEQSTSSARDLLNQNLAQIERLRADAQNALTSVAHRDSSKGNHPPVLRTAHHKTSSLSQETLARMNASSTFSLESSSLNPQSASEQASESHATLFGNSANAQFVNQQDDIVSVSAKRIPHPDYTVPAGELIPATLEVAINSDLPGMIRAITTRDIYSLSGGNRLIPSGSELVGQYSSGVVQGQRRLLAVWNRVNRADGVIVALNSPGTDAIGRAGIGADYVNTHFLERFSSSALLSILGGYAAIGGVGTQDQYNSKAQYRMGVANSLQQTAGQALEQDSDIKTTLAIEQGAKINVFVAHDLDFNAVGAVPAVGYSNAGSVGGSVWKQ